MLATCAACSRTAENRCSRCQQVSYCSGVCQSVHWATHKYTCRKLWSSADNQDQAHSQPPEQSSRGGLDLLARVSEQLEKQKEFSQTPSSAPYHRAARGGLQFLQQVSKQFAEMEKLQQRPLPKLCGVIASEIIDEEHCNHLRACLSSIAKQWRAPPELVVISWHAEKDFQMQIRSELDYFKTTMESGGEKIIYSGSQERKAQNMVIILEQQYSMSQFEHFHTLLAHIPQNEDYWLLLSSDDHIWHPARSAFMRNFTRQAGDAENCLVCALPLHASLDSPDAEDCYTEAEEVNDLLKQGIARVREVSTEIYQFCIRHQVLEEFFKRHQDAVVKHKLCYVRFISFLCHEFKSGLQCIDSSNPAMSQLKESNVWVYFSRKRNLDGSDWALAARGNARNVEVLPSDAELAEESLICVQEAVSCDVTRSILARAIACWRNHIEFMTLKQRRSDLNATRPLASVALEHVDQEFAKNPEFVKTWLTPMMERLIAKSCEAFDLERDMSV